MDFRSSLSLIYHNIKLLLNLNVLAAVLLILLIPWIFSFTLLEQSEVAKIMELYVSIIGIVLFSYIAAIEWNDNISETVYMRRTSYVLIVLLRAAMACAISLLLITGILLYAKAQLAVFPIGEFILGTLITIFFLGMLTFTVTNFTRQPSAGYLTAFAYYMLEYMTKGKYTRSFYLFSLIKGDFSSKYYILLIALVLLIANLVYIKKIS